MLSATQAEFARVPCARALVYRAVDELKSQDTPPERVIVSMKHAASDAGIGESGYRLIKDLTGWCIERYYKSDTPTGDRVARVGVSRPSAS